MKRTAPGPPLLIVLLITGPVAFGQDLTASFQAQVKPLIAAHCLDCHGPDLQKAGLRLDTLPIDLNDHQTMARWVRVHDKLDAGEMPPPDSERPPSQTLDAATRWLNRQLHAASIDRQQKQGRVVLRRLNSTEYENTIHDLLGIDIDLKDLLPVENALAGFDNVSALLDVSGTHQLSYQEAAEKVIPLVVPPHPPIPFSDQRTGLEIKVKGATFGDSLNKQCYLDGDAVILYSQLNKFNLCKSAHVPTAGRYRIQLMSCAVDTDNRAITAAFLTTERSNKVDPVARELRDIPAGKPAIVDVEMDLKAGQAFVVNLLTRWDIRNFKRPITEYTGPGLRVEWIKIEGPIEPFPPKSYDRLFAGVPIKARSVAAAEHDGRTPPTIPENRPLDKWRYDPLVPASAHPKQDAEQLIRDFLPRAFRGPVSEALQRHFVELVHKKLDERESFFDAMSFGYESILTSPHFLLFTEPGSVAVNKQGDLTSARLDDYALANRLSYFLWSSMPDDELMAAAKKQDLARPENLRAQVERMLKSPKSQRFTENFTGQWLDLRRINFTIPDPHLYVDFDELLLWSMPRETELFFDEVLRGDLSLLEFIDSDWTMLNQRLATHYGIPGVKGNEFRKVKLPAGTHRGGVMTHASVLKVTADGTHTSPVLRGKWVLERIIGKPPAPPPPDVPALEPDIRGATTIRQQLDKHRNVAVCASCHIHIDPPGFALESFDPIGGYREYYRASTRTTGGVIAALPYYYNRPVYRGLDVERGGRTYDGHAFNDIEDYKQILLADKDQLARSLTQKLLIYATGAEIQFADREVVEQIVATLRTKNYGFRSLVHEVVQSRVFLNK